MKKYYIASRRNGTSYIEYNERRLIELCRSCIGIAF